MTYNYSEKVTTIDISRNAVVSQARPPAYEKNRVFRRPGVWLTRLGMQLVADTPPLLL